ncbi:MAG: AAA family ATPase [bacterium]|nr:AAA family ATPase [bacterium]
MLLDLHAEPLFEDDELNLNKRITFIYGKNGTGKSTLAQIIKEQCKEYDVQVFQGFENIIDANKRLNAVVLGEENVAIAHQVAELEGQIQILNEQKAIITAEIEQPEDSRVSNYWTRSQNAKKAYEKKEKEIDTFCQKAAVYIKNQKNPQISSTSYDKRAFKKDIRHAVLLNDKEKKQYIELLKSDPKMAKTIAFPNIDFSKLVAEVNAIIQHKVEEKTKIARLENDSEKRNFADMGRRIHKRGEVCAFCGAPIKDSVFEELEKYFSVDEVKEFREQIIRKGEAVLAIKESVEQLEIDERDFYPEFVDDILQLKQLVVERKREYINILNDLGSALKNKLAYLFECVETMEVELPEDFSNISTRYNELKAQNNGNDLNKKQEKAREGLRHHFVREKLDKFGYSSKMSELNLLEKQKDDMQGELVAAQSKIWGENGINSQITDLREKAVELLDKTRNEKILAQHINEKLRYMVSFQLEHCEDESGKGYYLVKNIQTNETRDITQLSTGEKNIIAFLYFMEKLSEIRTGDQKAKFIVFDDPMNSNDDNMQYLIVEELQHLMKQIKANERFLLLTHNNHFYLNVKYSHNYKDDMFLRLQSNGRKTVFKFLTKAEEDFCTSYQALWKELIFLYNNAGASSSMLLNPMRRIIETYTKFNVIGHNAFCEKKSGAMKLFNVNSHSIDDLEADLCGKSKMDIVYIFCDCFNLNGALEHFKTHWPEFDTAFLERGSE